jgi:hypothetical protein
MHAAHQEPRRGKAQHNHSPPECPWLFAPHKCSCSAAPFDSRAGWIGVLYSFIVCVLPMARSSYRSQLHKCTLNGGCEACIQGAYRCTFVHIAKHSLPYSKTSSTSCLSIQGAVNRGPVEVHALFGDCVCPRCAIQHTVLHMHYNFIRNLIVVFNGRKAKGQYFLIQILGSLHCCSQQRGFFFVHI